MKKDETLGLIFMFYVEFISINSAFPFTIKGTQTTETTETKVSETDLGIYQLALIELC